jgi:hypothetical protein
MTTVGACLFSNNIGSRKAKVPVVRRARASRRVLLVCRNSPATVSMTEAYVLIAEVRDLKN